MPKTFIAKNVVSINPVQFQTKGDVVVGLLCSAEVNYGELGMTHQVDIWEDLSATQRTKCQQIYKALKAKVEAYFLGD